MSYNNRKENSYNEKITCYDDLFDSKNKGLIKEFLESLGSNDRSKEYAPKIDEIAIAVGTSKSILSLLKSKIDYETEDNYDKQYQDIYLKIITENDKNILEKGRLLNPIQKQMEHLNLLLKLLERSSQPMVNYHTHSIKLSKLFSSYKNLEQAYLADNNNSQSHNELKSLQEKGFIEIENRYDDVINSKKDYNPSLFCCEYQNDLVYFSKIFDILDIKAVKDLICEKIDKSLQEVASVMKELTPSLESIEKKQEKEEMTIGYKDHTGVFSAVKSANDHIPERFVVYTKISKITHAEEPFPENTTADDLRSWLEL